MYSTFCKFIGNEIVKLM